MSKYIQNDIISLQQGTYDVSIDFYKINRVTKTYYEISLVSEGSDKSWNTRRALMVCHADVNDNIKLHKRDIGWAFRNL